MKGSKNAALSIRVVPPILQLSSATATPLLVPQLRAHFLTRTRCRASARFCARTPALHIHAFNPGCASSVAFTVSGVTAFPLRTRTHARCSLSPSARRRVGAAPQPEPPGKRCFPLFCEQTRLSDRFNRHQPDSFV